ncbi:MAG TPA: chemotaxis protein CheW [Nitrospirota bacterium]|nr:chemotaxis protein CheW [Nitrospirota bacterium]
MDILAARKKAAEKARERRLAQEQHPAEQEPQQADVPEAQQGSDTRAAAEVHSDPRAGADSRPAAPAPEQPMREQERVPEQTAAEIEILAFRLGSEDYAVMVSDVREVLRTRELTRVPNAPAHILGVASLRGTMLPVIDLCRRLGLTPGVRDEKTRVVVVNPDDEDVGLLVDRVLGVIRIPEDAVKPAPENPEHGADYLRGIVRKNDNLYIILDLVKAVGS